MDKLDSISAPLDKLSYWSLEHRAMIERGDDLWNEIFHDLDSEPGWSTAAAGRVATAVEKAWREAVYRELDCQADAEPPCSKCQAKEHAGEDCPHGDGEGE